MHVRQTHRYLVGGGFYNDFIARLRYNAAPSIFSNRPQL
jgi:hypothetical protein